MKPIYWMFIVFSYISYSETCNHTIIVTDRESNLTSPGYPLPYHNNENCWWKLESKSPGSIIDVQVTFLDFDWIPSCSHDNLTFYDGEDASAPVLRRQCEDSRKTVVSSGNHLFIQFQTDHSGTGRGFVLKLVEMDKTCNHTIIVTERETNLTSPGYPLPYHNNENCWWKLETKSPGSIIGIQVTHLELEWIPSCGFDSLTFYDGADASAPMIRRQCDDRMKKVVSSGEHVFIQFKTDGRMTDDGFVLKLVEIDKDFISEGCSGDLVATSNTQQLELPRHVIFLPRYMTCTWTITTEHEGDTIDIRTHSTPSPEMFMNECQSEIITFYNGNTTRDTAVISEVCPKTVVPYMYVRSTQDVMTIVFKAASFAESGLELSYRSLSGTDCNRTVIATSHENVITSPGYPDLYYNNLNCFIRVESIMSHVLIRIELVDIEGSPPDCISDALTIYYNESLSGRQLTLCGTPSPRVMYSPSSVMYMQFRTDSATVSRGFRLVVTSVLREPHISNCGNTSLVATSVPQYLTSPNYPRNYQNYDECRWTITAARPGMRIRFLLVDTAIESSRMIGGQCPYDSLKAYNGPITEYSAFLTVCGDEKPLAQSSGPSLQLVFKADETTVDRGFKLKYYESNDTYLCGSHLHVDSGEQWITSPGWPLFYPENKLCRWTVQGPRNTNINLSAQVFHVEDSSYYCSYDYITIYDGLGPLPADSARQCGSKLYNYVSSGNSLTVIFHSDTLRTARGFKYRVTAEHLTSVQTKELVASYFWGTITSPNYPFNYPVNARRQWRIDTLDKNYRIQVKFDKESTHYSHACDKNYVEAFDGYSDSASSLGKFCGNEMSSKTSTGRYMFLKFKSGHTDGPSFKLSYAKQYHFSSDNESTTGAGAIIGGICGGIAIVVILVYVIAGLVKNRKQGPIVRTVHQSNMYTISSRSMEEPTAPATFMPPPSYIDATAGEGANTNPPPYSEIALHYKSSS